MKNIFYTTALSIIVIAVLLALFRYNQAVDKAQENCEPIPELQQLLCGEDLIEYKQ